MDHLRSRPARRLALTVSRRSAWLGLFCGILYSVGGLVVDLLGPGLNGGTALACLALVGMPLLFGAVGYVVGGVIGLLRGEAAP